MAAKVVLFSEICKKNQRFLVESRKSKVERDEVVANTSVSRRHDFVDTLFGHTG